jgi:tRNA1Val (adenine37-N6)-methyltransferase
MTPEIGETLDFILGGRLKFFQPRRGYRFSVDAVLLAHFARPKPGARVLELGAGCGVVAMILALLREPREVVALELQPALARQAERNRLLNGIDPMSVICGDLRARSIAGLVPESFDWVVANPPYRATGRGRESPSASRRMARSEYAATAVDFIRAAARYVRHGGRVAMVFTAIRSAELLAELRAHRLEPKRIRMVHPRAGARASTVLVEARKGGGTEVIVEPPLILYQEPGVYSEEARGILRRDIRHRGAPIS